MAAGSIIGATLGGLAVAYAPVAFLKVLLGMRVAGCGRQDRVCRSDSKLSIGAHMVENGISRTSGNVRLESSQRARAGID